MEARGAWGLPLALHKNVSVNLHDDRPVFVPDAALTIPGAESSPRCLKHQSGIFALISTCILLLSSTATAMNALTRTAPANGSPSIMPAVEGAATDWFGQVQKQLAEQEYYLSENADGELQAPNRSHNLRTFFDRQGVRIVDRTAETETTLMRMRYRGIGRGAGAIAPAGPAQAIRYQDNRVELEHGAGVTEWYINDQRGLEHGFILKQRPQGQLPLRIVLDISAAKVGIRDGDAIITNAGGRTLNYGKLIVKDATDQPVPARIERLTNTRFVLLIEDRLAGYPLWVDPIITATADTLLEENQVSAEFGTSVSSAGDVNGDGFADVIVGAASYDNGLNNEGAAFIYHGTAYGVATVFSTMLQSNQAGARLGFSVSGGGDFNGDGFADVIVGVPLSDKSQNNEGLAIVYYGSASGVVAGTSTLLEENQAGARLGMSVSTAGDVDGDGYADVIVGAHLYDNVEIDEGVAFVYYGSSSGVVAGTSTLLEENQAGARLGRSVSAAGDVNGDGYADVIVGANLYDNVEVDEGAAFVYYGSSSGVVAGSSTLLEEDQADAQLGRSVSGAGDVNGDGYADVIVGAHLYDNAEFDEGVAFVYYGSNTGVVAGTSTLLEENQVGAQLGRSVSGAGDIDGDGYADVIVGIPFYGDGEANEGAAFVYHGSASGLLTSASNQFESGQVDASLGWSVSAAGDVNGDGYADVIVGAYRYDNDQIDEGAAFIYHGSANGVATGNSALLDTNQVFSRMGLSVSGAGDVNGDGYTDVIVGASGYDNGEDGEGAAFVYHGSADGVASIFSTLLEENQANSSLGYSVSGAGDVNGDGYADVIVGARLYSNGEDREGAAFVYHGSAGGVASTFSTLLEENQANSSMGYSVSGAGDVNGDGYADVIIGVSRYDISQTDEGAAFVYYGSAAGVSGTSSTRLEEGQIYAGLGYSVSGAGDVNGDGYADVIVGTNAYDNGEANEGAAFVYHGSAGGISSDFSALLEEDQADASLGYSVSGAGDVNGDGYADVIVGAYQYDNGEIDEGAAFIYHGSAVGVSSVFSTLIEADQVGSNMGYSVSGAGDVNGDGYADVIVGAYRYDNGEIDEGAAFIYHGSAGGISSVFSTLLEENQAGSSMGISVSGAGDINGDGYADVVVGASFYANPEAGEGAAFVYHGNGSTGRPVLSRQISGNGGSQSVLDWGRSQAVDNFQVRLDATRASGRGKVKLQAEACPAGIAFGGPACSSQTSADWTTVTPVATTATLTETLSGLTANQLYRWRARVLHAPDSITQSGITAPPNPAHGPWRYYQAAVDSADVRMGNYQTRSVGFNTATSSTGEVAGPADIAVTLSTSDGLPSAQEVTADYATADGSASAGVDYTATSGTLAFVMGSADGSTRFFAVTLANDSIDEANETFTATLSAPSGASLGTSTHTATIIDDDTAGINLSTISGTTTEAGGTADFTVVLTSEPTADVSIGLSSSDTSEGTVSPASLTFTVANWNIPQTVTVTGVNDAVVDGNQVYSIVTAAASSTDNNYNGLNPSDVTVTNTDDETPGITVSTISGNTTEAGGTADFTVVLNSQPTADVSIGLISSDTGEGTVSPASLTFAAANWNIPQTVTVTGVDDAVVDGNQVYSIVTAAASSTDNNYNGLNPSDVAVTNTDDDTAGITVSTISGTTTETGGTADFTVVLTSEPTADVSIGLSSSDTSEGTVSPASLTFTAANWNIPQTVTVTGVNDAVVDGNQVYSIVTAAASSTDNNYNGLNPSDVTVTNTDDETPGITVSTISGNTTEVGGTADFTVVLNSQPTADVSIGLISSDTGEGTVSPASLTFTVANWDTPQTVTVTGVNDTVADGDQVYSIITHAASSTDNNYNGLNPSDVTVTNTDDELTPGTIFSDSFE